VDWPQSTSAEDGGSVGASLRGRSRWLDRLARASWLDAARAQAWRNVLLGLTGLAVLTWCALSRNGLDVLGKPLGTDFLSFYAASKLVLTGHAAGAYSVPLHHATEAAVFGHDVGYPAFFYPPLFLLICAPLAALPYFWALLTWLSVTGLAYLVTARAWLSERFSWMDAVAFPAVLSNLGHGQNAFLSAALIGSGARWLDRRPVLAGVAFGLLAYKPHLGLLLPVALVIARRWTVFASAAATVLVFAGVSLWVFGSSTWLAFFESSKLARVALETGLVAPAKMVSAFAAARVLGGPVGLAYAAQAAVIVYVAAGLARSHRRSPRGPAEPALLVTAALLGSPFLLDYDLVVLAFPLAWLAGVGARDGFRPWEKLALLAGFALPLIARPLALAAHLPLAPLVLLALFQLLLRRSSDFAGATTAQAGARDLPCPLNSQGTGGAEGNRTPDLLIANEALYQLSYGPLPG
jgi:alpha-1,2-mannosyltransferase